MSRLPHSVISQRCQSRPHLIKIRFNNSQVLSYFSLVSIISFFRILATYPTTIIAHDYLRQKYCVTYMYYICC
jgi:hypothetical protein